MSDGEGCLTGIYVLGCWVVGIVTFLGCWIYCIATYGFLLGVGLGWLPSMIVAWIAALAWPIILLVLVALLIALWGMKVAP